MTKSRSKTLLAFGDVHVPYHHPVALEVLCRAAERIRPDVIVCLGDLLDCSQFSAHPPTWGVPHTEYLDDLSTARAILDRLQATCRQLVLLEGNHEYRLDRWAASTAEGRGAYSMLAPRLQLAQNRQCVYIPYGSASGRYPHYRINSRIVAVHGWSYARHATKAHLTMSQGKSVIHGHCLPTNYEALTDRGWRRIVDLRVSDRVLAYHCGQMVWVPVLGTTYHKDWAGRVVVFNHPAIRQTMTELHGIYTAGGRYLCARDAMDLPTNCLVRRAYPVEQESGNPNVSAAELQLLVAACCDAIVSESGVRFCLRDAYKAARLLMLLLRLKYTYTTTTSEEDQWITINGCGKARLLAMLGGRRGFPSWLTTLDSSQLQTVVDELQIWRGRDMVAHTQREANLFQWLLAMLGQFSQIDGRGRVVVQEGGDWQRLGAVSQWETVSRFDTTCITTSARNFVCRTPAGSVELTGNTHRADAAIVQNIWSPGRIVEARSAGCLCRLVPLYGTGRPVEWVHAFVLGYLGRRSDTLYTVPILGRRCILPDGAEVVV